MDGTESDEWGGFGRPIFDDPSVRNLKRVGVIDVGSNSIRLVIFDGAARSPAYFFNEKVMAGLGVGLGETGHLNPEGRERALGALARFAAVAKAAEVTHISTVATAAVREASDGPDFVAEVERTTGLKLWVIDGREEARLSAQGVLLGWPGSYGLVCDIGGSSMELAEIREGRVGKRTTSQLGPQKLDGLSDKARTKLIKSELDRMSGELGPQTDRLFLVGGSWRAIARIDMERTDYPLHVLHEYRMTAKDVAKTADMIRSTDLEALRATCGISSARMALVPLAAEVLDLVVAHFAPHDIAVSSYGIREGMLYEQMPAKLRERDPLIEACRYAEAKDARLPGMGRRLNSFVQPLFPTADAEMKRIIRAACLLHDVSWRAHPDYRADIVFETATRANLGGLRHSERVFLGLALLHRYRNKREGTPFEGLYGILPGEDQLKAETLGKALRFGAMLWADPASDRPELTWDAKDRRLTLRLPRDQAALMGEVAQIRFAALASVLDAETDIELI
ncbi:MAG: Ppx/GppA family phosphatase [Shimia sp.]